MTLKSEHTKLYCANTLMCVLLVLSILLLPLSAWSFGHVAMPHDTDRVVTAAEMDAHADAMPCHTQAHQATLTMIADNQGNEHDCCAESAMILQCEACGPDCAYAKYPINYQSDDHELSMFHSPGTEATAELPINQNLIPPFRPPNA